MRIKMFLVAGAVALGALASPAFAQMNARIVVGTPPPPPVVEVVPAPRHGYVWVPGYWGWQRNRHVWVQGGYVVARPGYTWVPERWFRAGGLWRFVEGGWERERIAHRDPRRERYERRSERF